jgi:glycosyltransferase involved in cell wall biosynthesis
VTICLPVWQGAHLVDIAINGALAQTETDWELVVGDNASDDGLEAVVARHGDRRIRYHRWDEHVDVYQNFNRTMELARGEWVLPIGADDMLHPDALASLLAAAEPRPDAPVPVLVVAACRRVLPDGASADAFYYGALRAVDVEAGSYDAGGWLAIAATGGPYPWNMGSVLIARSVLAAAGAFRPDVGLAADMELVFRLSAYGPVAYLDRPLLDFMVRPDSDGNVKWSAERSSRDQPTPLARALLAALSEHQRRRTVSRAEQRAVRSGAARTHLVRAAQHRTQPGGRGRRGALADIRRAARLDGWTILHPGSATMILGALLAPTPLIRRVSTALRDRNHPPRPSDQPDEGASATHPASSESNRG